MLIYESLGDPGAANMYQSPKDVTPRDLMASR